jgi:hypothetical protein
MGESNLEQLNLAEENSKEKVIDMTNGNAIRMTRHDPFGLITLSLNKGQLPEKYRGFYTDWRSARKAVDFYLDERSIEEGKSERPTLQYKKGYGPEGVKTKE